MGNTTNSLLIIFLVLSNTAVGERNAEKNRTVVLFHDADFTVEDGYESI